MAEENTEKTTIVDEHRKMVLMTGALSDFQLQNLKTWPFIIFQNDILESANITYDFTKIIEDQEQLSPGTVQYDFVFKPNVKLNREETKKKLAMLTSWVRFMFWKETEVRILRAGKKWEV